MEPEDALWTDRSVFESELDGLIHSAITPKEPSSSKKRPAVQDIPNKRVKTEHPEAAKPLEDYSLHVHPSRKVLLDRDPKLKDASSPGDGREPNDSVYNISPSSSLNSSRTIPVRLKSNRKGRPDNRWATLSNTVRRQWEPAKDGMDYELLLEQRRKEKLQNVDRYVPDRSSRNTYSSRPFLGYSSDPSKVFPLDRLPDNVKTKIFKFLLVSQDPITVDFYWLRPFVKGHARVPSVAQSVEHEGTTYSLPVSWSKLFSDIELMRGDMLQFAEALETRGTKTKWTRSPCRGLSIGLLLVSRDFHRIAAPIFYGENIFKFPCPTSSWMVLDSFLATIGPENSSIIQHIRIHVPLWHRGVREDFVEGSIVDVISPASRMAVLKPPPHDRLLSAIRHIHRNLLHSNLVTLSLDLENGVVADHWTGRYTEDKRLISIADSEEFIERKREGIKLLKQLSERLASSQKQPVLHLSNLLKPSPSDRTECRKRLPRISTEAEKYGWRVDTKVRDSW